MAYRANLTGLTPLGDYSRARQLAEHLKAATRHGETDATSKARRLGFYAIGNGGSRRAWIHRADFGVVYKTVRYNTVDKEQQYNEINGCQAAKADPAAAPYVPQVWLWTFEDDLPPVLVLEELFPYDENDATHRKQRDEGTKALNLFVKDFHGGNWGVTRDGQLKMLDWGQGKGAPPARDDWWPHLEAVSPPPPEPPVERPKRKRPPRKARVLAAEIVEEVKPGAEPLPVHEAMKVANAARVDAFDDLAAAVRVPTQQIAEAVRQVQWPKIAMDMNATWANSFQWHAHNAAPAIEAGQRADEAEDIDRAIEYVRETGQMQPGSRVKIHMRPLPDGDSVIQFYVYEGGPHRDVVHSQLARDIQNRKREQARDGIQRYVQMPDLVHPF